MTSAYPPRRSWFFRQSWLVQFALVFFGAIALLSVVVIFWGMSSSFSSDGGESGSNSDPAALPTIPRRSTATIAASPTVEATANPTEEPESEPAATTTGPAPTTDVAALKEIYARAAESLQQPGMVYHALITITSESEPITYEVEGTHEQWVDANRNLSRSEIDTTITAEEVSGGFDLTRITTAGMDYEVYRKAGQRTDVSQSNTCYGANAAVSVVLGCPGGLEEATTTIEQGDYEGQPAVVLVKTGTSGYLDGRRPFTSRLYLSADTFLPIAREIERPFNDGGMFIRHAIYEHEFIPRDSLPADFFSTVALAEAQIEAMDVDYPIYWLGTSFEPGGDLRPVVLGSADPPHPTSQAEYELDLQLSYRTAEPQFMFSGAARSVINIQTWSPEAWHAEKDAAVRSNWEAESCQVQHAVEIPDGQATIFMGTGGIDVSPDSTWEIATATPVPEAECGNVEYTRFEAIVDLGDSVLFIRLPEGSSYRSQAGLEAIVNELEPR